MTTKQEFINLLLPYATEVVKDKKYPEDFIERVKSRKFNSLMLTDTDIINTFMNDCIDKLIADIKTNVTIFDYMKMISTAYFLKNESKNKVEELTNIFINSLNNKPKSKGIIDNYAL